MSQRQAGDQLGAFRLVSVCGATTDSAWWSATAVADSNAESPNYWLQLLERSDHDSKLRFENAQRALSTLQGPHVPVLAPDFVAADNDAASPYRVLRAVDGETLQARLARWQQQPAERSVQAIADIGLALARAVQSLHAQHAVLNTLHADQIWLRPDGSVLLLDWGDVWQSFYPDLRGPVGAAKALQLALQLAPEQRAGVRDDRRSDIYAIGALLFQLCTGQVWSGGSTMAALTTGNAHDPQLPLWLQIVVRRCLEPDPSQRYAGAALLAFDLRFQSPDQRRPNQLWRALTGPLMAPFKTINRLWHAARIGHSWRVWRGRSPNRRGTLRHDTFGLVPPIVVIAFAPHSSDAQQLAALRVAVARLVGLQSGARMVCVSMLDPVLDSPTQRLSQAGRQAHWARALRALGHPMAFHVMATEDAATALCAFAQDIQANVLVLGRPNAPNSILHKVAENAPCSVLLVQPDSFL